VLRTGAALYADTATWKLARRFKRPISASTQRRAQLGLRRAPPTSPGPHACRLRRGDEVGKAYRFPKGHVPANKGLRRPGWATGRMKETQFKKGQANHNVMPIGATRLVDGYVYLKVAEVRYVPYTVNWKPLHVLNWERANGRPLPADSACASAIGDRLNCALENLELITRAENMRRNTSTTYPNRSCSWCSCAAPCNAKSTEGKANVKNKIEDLRNHLFETLEALKDKEKPMEIERAKAISEVAQTIINSAKVEVDFLKHGGGVQGSGFMPTEKQIEGPAGPASRASSRAPRTAALNRETR
jgi:hypothetical protein